MVKKIVVVVVVEENLVSDPTFHVTKKTTCISAIVYGASTASSTRCALARKPHPT